MQNDMRDRLIELHKKAHDEWLRKEYEHETDKSIAEYVVDELLTNGVIAPPCNIGDTAYCITYSKNGYKNIAEHRVVGFHIINAPPKRAFKRENYLILFHEQTNLTSHSSFKKIGETVFFTREEAEQALKERESNA